MIGQVVGNYKILSALGEGGMGTVYKAVDVMLEREVAIKMLRPEIASQPQIVERFRSEAVTLAKLNHPSIATLYSFFRQGDQFFMVMEFVAGQTLDHLIRQSGALPADRATSILAQALDGIGHAHAMGILHRDLKPSNIMLPATGGVKVMDFGIARLLNAARMTRTGGLVGTLEYVAPERVRGQEADLRSDLYSMGIVLFEMLTGRVPFHSDTEYELMRAQLEQAPPTLTSLGVTVPPDIEAALMRSLAKNPEERFSSAAEFRAALIGPVTPIQEINIKPTRLSSPAIKETRMADSIPPTVMATATPPPAATVAATAGPSARKSNLAIYGAIAAAVLVLGAGGAYWTLHRNIQKPAAPVATPSSPPGGPSAATTASPGAPPSAPADPRPVQIPNLDVPTVHDAPASKPVVKRAAKGSTGSTSSSTAADTTNPQQPVEQPTAPVITPPRPVPVTPPVAPPVNRGPSITTLSDVQTLCIAPMTDNLNGFIASEIVRQLGGRFRIVPTPSQADAVMRGTATAEGGIGRSIGVQSDASASVVITDRSGARTLWSDSVTARRVLGGVLRKGGPSGLAEHIVADLRRALR